MPKLKTSKSVTKRFKVTGTGKLMRRRPGKGHILTSKTRKRKRKLRGETVVGPSEHARIMRTLPYGK